MALVRHSLSVLSLLVCLLPRPIEAQTADTVILKSGHPVIGEIKDLRRGNLSFDTEEMDVVSIDWDDIASVISPRVLEVYLATGDKFAGRLSAAAPAELVVVGATRTDTIPFAQIVEIRAFEQGFWDRTNGFVDLGTNIARANNLASFLFGGQFNYRGPRWGFNITTDFYRQRQETTDTTGVTTEQSTSRSSLSLLGERYIGTRWAAAISGTAEQNEELQLDSRYLGQLGAAYRIIRNQGMEFGVGAGGTINDEQFVGSPRSTTGEILVGAVFDMFDVGDFDLYTSVQTFSNPSDGGRFRLNIDGRIAWEIISDFTIGVTVVERYDSSPPSPTAATRDYQYSLTFGWSWS
jgi:hypothetical protein